MKRLLILAPAAALAAGCSGNADQIQPGQWETSVQFSSIEVPGMPPEAAESMRQMMARPRTTQECITPEQAANPTGNLANVGGGPGNCEFGEQTFSGGTMRMRATCRQADQTSMQMSMDGTYTATTMQANITSEVTPPAAATAAGAPQQVRMRGTFSSRRIGDCPA